MIYFSNFLPLVIKDLGHCGLQAQVRFTADDTEMMRTFHAKFLGFFTFTSCS